MSAPTALLAAKAGLAAACTTLFPDADVVNGPADDDYGPEQLVEIRDGSFSEVDGKARMSNQRRRWFDFSIDVRFVISSGGGEDVQADVTTTALTMTGQLADYLQDAGVSASTQTSLGGAVQWARLSSVDFTEEDEDIENGRTTTVEATVTGQFLA